MNICSSLLLLLLEKSMCFIKASCLGSLSLIGQQSLCDIDNSTLSPYSNDICKSASSIGYAPSFSPPSSSFLNSEALLLNSLLASIQLNSKLLMKLGQNIEHSQLLLTNAQKEIEEQCLKQANDVTMEAEGWKSSEKIIQKLFGDKTYRYKLKLRHKFPSTIYKERNINLTLQLLDGSQKVVMNSNIMNICVATCEADGKWVCEDEEGRCFIQGKTEVEMYHGEASFLKIYPRDVSRQFQNGRISIIFYPKPSLIQFSTSAGMVQRRVNADEIEPLIIKDVTVRAKKKAQ